MPYRKSSRGLKSRRTFKRTASRMKRKNITSGRPKRGGFRF